MGAGGSTAKAEMKRMQERIDQLEERKDQLEKDLEFAKGVRLPWQILVELRDHTGFANWKESTNGWGTLEEHRDPSQCAGWVNGNLAGVTVDDSGEITKIDLRSSNLAGGKPPCTPPPHLTICLARTTSTTTNAHSVLPESIGQLQSLTKLWLQENAITGKSIFSVFVVPVDLVSVLTHIVVLPESIGQLSSLTYLHCGGCELTGTCLGLPVDLASVITHISVLPDSIGQLSILSTLDLGDNELSGTIYF
jgi:Leucine-rich repeat (LRR) protein